MVDLDRTTRRRDPKRGRLWPRRAVVLPQLCTVAYNDMEVHRRIRGCLPIPDHRPDTVYTLD